VPRSHCPAESTSNLHDEDPGIHQTTSGQGYLQQAAVQEDSELTTSMQQFPVSSSSPLSTTKTGTSTRLRQARATFNRPLSKKTTN
jgi:hypothetical protein